MRQYIIRRALLIPVTILGVSLLVTATLELLPGNIADIILAESGGYAPGLTRENIESDLGLDRNVFVRWGSWLGNVAQGDFGNYFRGGRPVGDELLRRAPVTLQLAGMALVISLLIALPIGVLSAIRQDTILDYIARSSAIFMLAVPSFFLGVLFFILVRQHAGWLLPEVRYANLWDEPFVNLKQMWAPAVILAFAQAGSIMRLTRAQMLEVLRQDYVRTAWSKGLRERSVVVRHAVKNAFIPVVTLIGIQINILVSGSIVLEFIFGLPGLGLMLLEALSTREYLAVQGVLLLVATLIVITNFLIDMTYSMLDPRIRYT
jgi:peptide/nickel transport system permease protein